jgi:PadR family transcriptional regulator PadR
MNVESWQAQLRKGAAELVVLSLLKGRALYGLELLDAAGGSGGVLSDGTLYPLLARLEREGKLAAQWVLAEDAKIPRKYYRLTAEGEALLAEMHRLWREFSAFVGGAVEERIDDRRPAPPRRSLARRARA